MRTTKRFEILLCQKMRGKLNKSLLDRLQSEASTGMIIMNICLQVSWSSFVAAAGEDDATKKGKKSSSVTKMLPLDSSQSLIS